MEFKKVIEKDKNGNDVEVIKQTTRVSIVQERATTLEEQEARLEALKVYKLKEIERWNGKIAKQRQRLIECATALGVTLDPAKLDAPPAEVEEEKSEIISAGGQEIDPEKSEPAEEAAQPLEV